MKRIRISVLLLFAVLFVAAAPVRAEIRAAFDIGSVNLRMQVVSVELTDGAMRMTSLTRGQERIDLTEALRSGNGSLSVETIDRVAQSLKTMVEKARNMGAETLVVTAGSGLRRADNGRAAAKRLGMLAGVRVLVLSAREEAALSYAGAAARLGVPADNLCLWDIGGSQMLLRCNSTEPPAEYSGRVGSVTFRDEVIRQIQQADPQVKKSPNPLGPSGATAAVQLARSAVSDVPAGVRQALTAAGVVVAGSGGVHAQSIAGQLGNPASFDQPALEVLLAERSQWDDAAFGSEYADTQATNIALVLGCMRALNIHSVRPVRADITDGLLVSEDYWP